MESLSFINNFHKAFLHFQTKHKAKSFPIKKKKKEKKMSSRSKAWLVAATIGAVEASKDQLGLCRWNYMIRSVNQRIRNNLRSAAQANRFSSSSTTAVASCKDGDKAKQAEESLRTVMYLSCWGPN
ncbi:uncharacterized protein LOC108809809 [Raphanus sativus]|uniref:Uncharacterized protein LOC108809809 n=1 Tax=Raphanus sativus TaxID=3726 RepID=A0A6J0JRR2_RAPSA|nr:uncharacterized protein LOC108809809 [Raphanus sativus]